VTAETANFCDRGCPMEWANQSHDDGQPRTSPVGSFLAGTSVYGAQDMVGNVWEWVADWYDANYYASGFTHNPLGPDDGVYRVIRGGSWVSSAKYLRVSNRFYSDPNDTSNDHGFRCVVTQVP
jgi:eukaryotic-like serine/threonine-protein kinase